MPGTVETRTHRPPIAPPRIPAPMPMSRALFTSPLRSALIGLVRLYQYTFGAILPGSCRFVPTCSQYAVQALRKHGALKGSWLTLKRIIRCNPYCKGGSDPVP